jgi:dTDP-glucose 4,6-dehydratase
MQNVLVTGGAGFIGSNFIRFLLEAARGVKIVNLDALTYAGNLENLQDLPDPGRHHFIHGDIGDGRFVEGLLRQHGIDTVVHFAAETHVDRSIRDPAPFLQTNVLGTCHLLEACRRVWLEERMLPWEDIHFLHVSTDEVYGSLGPHDAPCSEEAPFAPNSPYAASKAAADHWVRAYGTTYGLPQTITHCSNNYGPHMFPEKFIPLIVWNALHGRPLPIYGDGRHVREWLYVEDHCEALWLILRAHATGRSYNIGGVNAVANVELVEHICALLDSLCPSSPHRPYRQWIRFVEDRPGHDRRYALDASRLHRDLGWEARHSLENGLLKTMEWILAHTAWFERVCHRDAHRAWLASHYGCLEQ